MKKLLLLSLSTILCTGTMLATIEPVSTSNIIFNNEWPSYTSVPLNIEKLVIANTIISPDRKNNFYHDLLALHGITKQELLDLINSHYNTSGNIITFVSDVHVSELLKEQRNIIVKDIYKFINQRNFFLGETRAEDYLNYAEVAIGTMIILSPIKELAPITSGIGSIVVIGNLYRLYKHIQYIRNKEEEIREIDYMITAIEKIEQTEASQ
jgi:hypothetical protein